MSPELVMRAVDVADRGANEILGRAHLEIGKLQAGDVRRAAFAAFGGCAQQKRGRSATAITTTTAIPIITRLESRSSATGVCWPSCP